MGIFLTYFKLKSGGDTLVSLDIPKLNQVGSIVFCTFILIVTAFDTKHLMALFE